jgi:transcriptional regulator with XRE-family HTH domain
LPQASGVSERDDFGPNLRRLRLQRGVSLESIAASTKVSVSLWAGLERNNLSRWPTGIYARGYVREYAHAIGEDPESTVDEFCRWFPQGDRRVAATIHEHARIVGHISQWRDDLAVVIEGDRRGSPSTRHAPASYRSAGMFLQVLRRAFGRA